MRLTTRQRIEVSETLPSHARENRLQIKDVNRITAMGDDSVDPSGNVAKMRLYDGKRNNLRSPPAQLCRARSCVKGSLRQALPALDAATGFRIGAPKSNPSDDCERP